MTRSLGTEALTVKKPLAPPRTTMRIPEKRRNPPRVTTKDGILSRAVSVPWAAPTAAQASNATIIAAHHGQADPGCWTNLKATTPPKSATAPTERSTSAMSRTTVSAMASTMYTVLSPKIYTRLLGRRKACSGVTIWKTTATTIMARSTGRTPLSPLRTLSHQARRYWPSDWATSSRTSAAASGAAVRSAAVAVSDTTAAVSPGTVVTGTSRSAPMSSALVTSGSGRLGRSPVGATRRHVLHYALPV